MSLDNSVLSGKSKVKRKKTKVINLKSHTFASGEAFNRMRALAANKNQIKNRKEDHDHPATPHPVTVKVKLIKGKTDNGAR